MIGYIVIKHQLFKEISDAEVLEMLKGKASREDIHIVDCKHKIIDMEEIPEMNHQQAKAYQRDVYETQIKALIEKYPEHKIAYFGTVSIALALHLGYCVGAWRSVEIFNLDRETNTWIVDETELAELPTKVKYPRDIIEVNTDVLFKVEASYTIQDSEVKESIDSGYQSVHLSLENFDKNAFRGNAHIVKFGGKFSEGLDAIANCIPSADKIHLIVTAPVGVVFYLGTRINPNVTKPIVTYQYGTTKTPPYEDVFVLQEEVSVDRPMTEEDKAFIDSIRSKLAQEIEQKIVPFAKSKSEEQQKHANNWIDLILPSGSEYLGLKTSYWQYVSDISKTSLASAKLSGRTDEADKREGFYLAENGEWQITDRFIFNIAVRLKRNEAEILRALRMFIFHEAFHVTQSLTQHTAPFIGRFPRVLEEADYVADVWAFLHEYALSKLYYSVDTNNHKEFFKTLFYLATETMWSFVELSNDYNEMQIRGLNRFLIWYWEYNLIDDARCVSIKDISDRLALKPILEIKGLRIKAVNQRTIYRLNGFKANELEIGYFDPATVVRRMGNAGGIDLVTLIEGFRKRNGDTILNQMKALYHNVGPSLKFG